MAEKDLIIYENELIRIYSPNIHKPGGTIFIYLHKPSGSILVVDAGLNFSAERMIADNEPNISEEDQEIIRLLRNLIKRRHPKPVDILLTHGHFDHIAGVELLSREFEIMWHGSPTTKAMIGRSRQRNQNSEEKTLEDDIKFNLLKCDYGKMDLGVFNIDYFQTVHSIPETLSFVISTQDGFKGLHMAEFRTRECSHSKGLSDKMFTGVKQGANGRPYDIVLYDALRSELGFSASEDVIRKPIEKILNSPDFPEEGALILPFISSKVWQISIIQEIANQYGCRMHPAGRAMKEMTEYARSRGWVAEQAKSPNRRYKRLLIPCTGSQNEPGAALPRAIDGSARDMCLLPTDWLMMVQCAIPHYLEEVRGMYKNIMRRCGRFVLGKGDLHHLGFGPNDKRIIVADNLIGEKFETSSGHGRLSDHEMLKANAPCPSGQYIGYQSEEETIQPGDAESNAENGFKSTEVLEELRRELLQIFDE